MKKFSKFNDWESQKYEAQSEVESVVPKSKLEANASLLAQIAEVDLKRKAAVKNRKDFEARILEIDGKLLRMEVDKNNLLDSRDQLTAASKIAKETRKEGKGYEQD